MSTQRPALSLAELDAYDPNPIIRGDERRYLCPLCGDGKPRDNAHRCLPANTQSGAWNCHRCKTSGKLRETWSERPQQSRRECVAIALNHAFGSETAKPHPRHSQARKSPQSAKKRHPRLIGMPHDNPAGRWMQPKPVPEPST